MYKAAEAFVLFILIPLFFYFDFIPLPKVVPLLVVFLISLGYLLFSRKFNRKELGLNGFSNWRQLALRMLLAVLIVYGLTLIFIPERLFFLPKNNPRLWVIIMVLYPIWSAFTQELIYRSFFFYRYKTLFPNAKFQIIVNGLLFGFLHIIFGNWLAVVGSALVGLHWANAYYKHKSLMVVFIEHSFVGNLLYTFGLGSYFYVPDF